MKYINNLNELEKELLFVENFDNFKKSNWYPRFYVYSVGKESLPDLKNIKFTSLRNIKNHITNKVGYLASKIYLLNPHKEDDDFDVVLVSSRNESGKKWQNVFELTGTVKKIGLK